MSVIKSRIRGVPAVPFMADFVPLSQLWEGPNAPYPSEYSARWALRKLGDQLAKAQAAGRHRGRIMVHPVRFAQVAEQIAVENFLKRTDRS